MQHESWIHTEHMLPDIRNSSSQASKNHTPLFKLAKSVVLPALSSPSSKKVACLQCKVKVKFLRDSL